MESSDGSTQSEGYFNKWLKPTSVTGARDEERLGLLAFELALAANEALCMGVGEGETSSSAIVPQKPRLDVLFGQFLGQKGVGLEKDLQFGERKRRKISEL